MRSVIATSILLLFLASNIAKAQKNENYNLDPVQSQPIISSHLIMGHEYDFKFNSDLKLYVTFDDAPLDNQDNIFTFKSFKSGDLKVYKIDALNDTIFLSKRFLKFELPVFVIDFSGKLSGADIARNKLKYLSFNVGIPDSEMTYSFPFSEITLQYQKMGKLKKVRLENNSIPATVAEEIDKSGSSILILDITIKFGYQKLRLSPAIYYLR